MTDEPFFNFCTFEMTNHKTVGEGPNTPEMDSALLDQFVNETVAASTLTSQTASGTEHVGPIGFYVFDLPDEFNIDGIYHNTDFVFSNLVFDFLPLIWFRHNGEDYSQVTVETETCRMVLRDEDVLDAYLGYEEAMPEVHFDTVFIPDRGEVSYGDYVGFDPNLRYA